MRPLGGRRVLLALGALGFGLLTFFVPLITTAAPVMGTTRWSPYAIAIEIVTGELPPSTTPDLLGTRLSSIPLMITAIYLLQILALVVVCALRSPEILKAIAISGLFTSWFWRGDRIGFEQLFYGNFSYHGFSLVRRVGFGQLTFILLGVMASLWFIAANDDLDAQQGIDIWQLTEKGCDSQAPEILDTEILQGDDDIHKTAKPHQRLRE